MKASLTTRTSLLLLITLVLGIYYPAIFYPLNSVDDPGMYGYLLNTDHFSLRDIFFPGNAGNYYRPMLVVSYLMDKYVWGLEVSFMHLENVLFHLLNTLLLFAIARKVSLMQGIRSALLPLVVAVFFAVHPINTESVNWIAGRTDLLAGIFLLLSVLLLLTKRGNPLFVLLAALSMLVACLAKESAVFFLPAALLFPVFLPEEGAGQLPLAQRISAYLVHATLFCGATICYFLMRSSASGHGDQGVATVVSHVVGPQSPGLWAILRMILKAAGFYLKKIVIPFPLSFAINHVSDFYLPLGILLLVAILRLLTRRSAASYFFICAACVASASLVIPIVHQSWTPLAERYLYIPSAFFLVGVALNLYHCKLRPRYQTLISWTLGGLAVIAVYGTLSRGLVWRDNLALYQDTLRKSPGFGPAQNEVANALAERGRSKEASDLILSMKVTEDMPNFQLGLVSKSCALENRGDFPGAEALLRKALENPGKHEAALIDRLLKLYEDEVKAGKSEDAKLYPERVRLLLRRYQITGDGFTQYRLGVVHLLAHQEKLAQAAFARAAETAPVGSSYREPAVKLSKKLSGQETGKKEL